MPAPILHGVTLPLPSSHVLDLVPVVDDVDLVDGTTTRYHRGHKVRVALRWRNVTQAVRDQVVALGRLRDVTQYVDIDGTPYVVRVDELDGVDPIPGTDPVRYTVGLTVAERRPR